MEMADLLELGTTAAWATLYVALQSSFVWTLRPRGRGARSRPGEPPAATGAYRHNARHPAAARRAPTAGPSLLTSAPLPPLAAALALSCLFALLLPARAASHWVVTCTVELALVGYVVARRLAALEAS